MAIATAVTNESEMFKIVYPKEMINDRTEVDLLQQMAEFNTEAKTGEKYRVPVSLTAEAGVTYLANDQATSIAAAISSVEKQAEIQGSQIFVNGAVTKKAISASLGSKQAFKRATAHKVMSMLESAKERLEWELLYGQDARGLGVVSASAGSGGTRTLTLTLDSYSAGLWSGKTGTQLDVYDTTGATQRNTIGPITVVTANVDATVRTVTVSGAAADLTAVVATDVLWFRNQKGQSCVGLKQIASQTTGTLFGIDLTTYDLFKGNTFAVGGAISYDKVMAGLGTAVARGLRGNATLFLSTESWKSLAKEVKELQQFVDGSQVKKAELGPEGEAIRIAYHRGMLKVVAHPLVRIGDGLLFQDGVLERVGSTDLTFDAEGGGPIFFEVPNSTYKSIVLHSDQALFCGKPSRTLFFSGITG